MKNIKWIFCLFLSALFFASSIYAEEEPNALKQQADEIYKAEKYDEAEPLYRKALYLLEKTNIIQPGTVEVSTSLADVYRHQSKLDLSEAYYKQALAISKKVYGPASDRTMKAKSDLAEFYASTGMSGEPGAAKEPSAAAAKNSRGSR